MCNDGVILFGDARPVVDAGSAEGIDGELESWCREGGEVDDVGEVVDVGGDVVVAVGVVGGEGACVGDALDVGEAGGDELVGAVLDPLGGGGVGGAAVGWVVLEAAVLGWIVRGGDDDAVGAVELEVGVVGEDGVGEGGGGGVAEVFVDHDFDVVGGEDLEGGGEGGLGEGVGVLREEEGAERCAGWRGIRRWPG